MQANIDDVLSIQFLKKAFTSKHYPELFTGEGTHEPALTLARL